MAVRLGVTRIPVVAPARSHQKIHNVQPEADISRSGPLIEKTGLRNAADVALFAHASLKAIGVDLHVLLGLSHLNLRLVFVRDDRKGADRQSDQNQQTTQRGKHVLSPWHESRGAQTLWSACP
jgi:hypothetical protein